MTQDDPNDDRKGRKKTLANGRKRKGDGSYGQHPDGRFYGSVELPRGADGRRRRKEITDTDFESFQRRFTELKKQVADGRAPTTNHVTVERWCQHWHSAIAPRDSRPGSLKNYDGYIRNYITPTIGAVQLRHVKPAHIRQVHDAATSAGRSTALALHLHWCLSSALKAAVYEGLLPDNPVDRVRPPRVVRKKRSALTGEQAKHLLASCIEHDDPMTTRWAAALMLGGRQGELLGLTWDRVDFRNLTINLEWALDELPISHGCGSPNANGVYPCGGKWATRCTNIVFDVPDWFDYRPLHRALALVEPKTDKSRRVIPLPLPLAYLLQEYRKRCRSNEFGLVWATPDGHPIRPKHDLDAWKAAIKRAGGLPDVVLHEARHSTASLLLEAGVPQEIIMQIMGHSSVLTTRGYQHHNLELSRAALGKLDTLLPPMD